jgi:hypothetical protein
MLLLLRTKSAFTLLHTRGYDRSGDCVRPFVVSQSHAPVNPRRFEQGMFFPEHRHTGADAVNLRGCQRPFCKGWSDD